jgi:ABC-type Na+ efflux pump permease subunit
MEGTMIKALKEIKAVVADCDEQGPMIDEQLARAHDAALTEINDIVKEVLEKIKKELWS